MTDLFMFSENPFMGNISHKYFTLTTFLCNILKADTVPFLGGSF